MTVEFTVKTLPQSQGSMKAFVMPNKDEIERAARNILSGRLGFNEVVSAITTAAKKTRAILTSDNTDLKAYRNVVALHARRAMAEFDQDLLAAKHVPVGVRLEFVFERPASVTKKRLFPVVKPDLDKLERAVLDSLTQIVYADDAQVVESTKRKVYGAVAQVKVSVWTLEEGTTGLLF